MNLKTQKRIAANIIGCSPKKVKIKPEAIHEIKNAITKEDLREHIKNKKIIIKPIKGVSRARARKIAEQRKKGLRKGPGSRKSKKTATLSKKDAWIKKIRIQRKFLKELKEKGLIDNKVYHELYSKSKGGFFRSKRHIKIYLEENELIIKK